MRRKPAAAGRSCEPGHRMLRVAITLINSTAVRQATHIDSQHSSGSPRETPEKTRL